jgi:hypothetical protein
MLEHEYCQCCSKLIPPPARGAAAHLHRPHANNDVPSSSCVSNAAQSPLVIDQNQHASQARSPLGTRHLLKKAAHLISDDLRSTMP